MDINLSSNGGNASAVTQYAPRLRKLKGYGNFADSNTKAVKTQSKKQIKKKRETSKARPKGYKQNFG